MQTLTLQLQAQFAKFGQTFRKTLPLDYKRGNKHTHKNMHAIPMLTKEKLLKKKDWATIREMERNSSKPYGQFTRAGFVFDKERLPFFDIPDLAGFELQPYVEYNAPKIDDTLKNHQMSVNRQKMEKVV